MEKYRKYDVDSFNGTNKNIIYFQWGENVPLNKYKIFKHLLIPLIDLKEILNFNKLKCSGHKFLDAKKFFLIYPKIVCRKIRYKWRKSK